MLRKIQKIGNSFYIALPINWIQEYNLKKGSEVRLEVRESGELTILPMTEDKREDKEVILEYEKSSIEKRILGYYLFGYNIIKIIKEKGFSHEEREEIIRIVRKLSGLEIVDERMDLITLQNLIDETSIHPFKLLFRMNAITSTMYVDAVRSSLEGEKILNTIFERDEEVDRLYFLMVRQLRSLILRPALLNKLELTLLDCLDLRIAAHFIEKIGDEAARLAKIFAVRGTKLNPEFLKNVQEVTFKLQNLQEKILISFARKKGNFEDLKQELLSELRKLDNMSQNISLEEVSIINAIKEIINFNIDIYDLITSY
ncbi:MAG TPA: phosphate uptake regulator PhoU [Geobacterales bacterium]|nr:phosphate uptake regulator PhoU [Geobacterales bacterium]